MGIDGNAPQNTKRPSRRSIRHVPHDMDMLIGTCLDRVDALPSRLCHTETAHGPYKEGVTGLILCMPPSCARRYLVACLRASLIYHFILCGCRCLGHRNESTLVPCGPLWPPVRPMRFFPQQGPPTPHRPPLAHPARAQARKRAMQRAGGQVHCSSRRPAPNTRDNAGSCRMLRNCTCIQQPFKHYGRSHRPCPAMRRS